MAAGLSVRCAYTKSPSWLRRVESLELECVWGCLEAAFGEPVDHPSMCLVAKDDLPAFRRSLQACGEVRGGSEHGHVSARDGSSDDRGSDGDPDSDGQIEKRCFPG